MVDTVQKVLRRNFRTSLSMGNGLDPCLCSIFMLMNSQAGIKTVFSGKERLTLTINKTITMSL